MHKELSISKKLQPFLTPEALPYVVELLNSQTVEFTISRRRNSKFGDYMPVRQHFFGTYKHKISVNGDLNPHAFLLTFLHEWAHLKVFSLYSNKVAPHGKEWKTEFSSLCRQFVGYKVFPLEVESALSEYLKMPDASTATNVDLLKTLNGYGKSSLYTKELSPKEVEIKAKVENMNFDLKDPSILDGEMYRYFTQKQMFVKTVEELLPGAFFLFKKNIFCVQVKLRKYYLCKCLTTPAVYKIHPLAEILEVEVINKHKIRILN